MLATIARGLLAGTAGAAAMTVASKAEQAVTRRPNSYVPARTLGHLLGLPSADDDRLLRNWAMHYGTGALAGVVRAVMARANLRGAEASLLHTGVRLTIDQTLENGTGVGAPPSTWPRQELVIDTVHKAIYSFATGVVADALIEPAPTSSVKRPAQRLRLPGFA